MPPEYQNPNPTPTTNSDYFSKYVVDPVKAILDTNLHKSLPILLIVGYVFIAFNTGFDKFIKVLYFTLFKLIYILFRLKHGRCVRVCILFVKEFAKEFVCWKFFWYLSTFL